MQIIWCKFLPDCSPEPKLFSFQHTGLALSTWISTVLNTTRSCACARVNVFIPVTHCKSGSWTCRHLLTGLEEGIIEWLEKVGMIFFFLQCLLEKSPALGIDDDLNFFFFIGLVLGICLAPRREVAVVVPVLVVADYVQNFSSQLVPRSGELRTQKL